MIFLLRVFIFFERETVAAAMSCCCHTHPKHLIRETQMSHFKSQTNLLVQTRQDKNNTWQFFACTFRVTVLLESLLRCLIVKKIYSKTCVYRAVI